MKRTFCCLFVLAVLAIVLTACTNSYSYSGKKSQLTNGIQVSTDQKATVQYTCTPGTPFTLNAVNTVNSLIDSINTIKVTQTCPDSGSGSDSFLLENGSMYLDIQATASWSASLNITD